MSKVFNVVTAGSLSDTSVISRPLSTANANNDTGIEVFSLADTLLLPNSIASEGLPLKGIFLHIDTVRAGADSLISITINSPSVNYTLHYPASALYRQPLKDNITLASQYWQGFELNTNVTIPSTDTFTVKVSSSSLIDIKLVGDSVLGFNRFFTVSGASEAITGISSPTLCIGSYISPLEFLTPTQTTSITADVSFFCQGVNIWSNSVLYCSSIQLQTTDNITVAADGNLTLYPGATAVLDNDAKIICINNATVSAVGDYKLPFSFLSADIVAGNYECSINDTSTWQSADLLYFPSNTSSNTNEVFPITSIAGTTVGIKDSFTHFHPSKNYYNTLAYRDINLDAPVCNLTRNTLISATGSSSYLAADNNSRLVLENVQVQNCNLPGKAAINLYNNYSNITGCSISCNWNGVDIPTNLASNYNISNNIFYSCLNGVIVDGAPTFVLPYIYNISDNIIVKSTIDGINASYLTNIKFNNNFIIDSGRHGINIGNSTGANASIYQINNNRVYGAFNTGIILENCLGSIDNSAVLYSRLGLIYNSINQDNFITVRGLSAALNTQDGVVLNNCKISAYDLTCLYNGAGINYNNVYGNATLSVSLSNKTHGINVYNCNVEEFQISNATVTDNIPNISYSYPSQYGWNFYPTYLIRSTVGSSNDFSCITLNNTKCEKFVVQECVFCSTGPNIQLQPAADSLIEGSYIFTGCLFTGNPFDNVESKYQTTATHEAGFAIMYENNTKKYSKNTSAGRIESDSTVYKNQTNQISEKLTPAREDLLLTSSKRLVLLDNFDSSVPPNLIPEYLHAHVWVKKDSNWGNNSNPRLMVAASPVFSIVEDTIIDVHDTNTTDWVQLSSTVPIASAVDVRGVVELYVSCQGNSGGSINIDDWHINIV